MAERTAVITTQSTGTVIAVWSGILLGDTCKAVDYEAYSDRAAQVSGVFGGATITIEGSLFPLEAGAVWGTLTDPQGNNISMTAAKIEFVTEPTRWIRPVLSGGDGTTNLTVHMLMRRR
jgi:hypothetical protein